METNGHEADRKADLPQTKGKIEQAGPNQSASAETAPGRRRTIPVSASKTPIPETRGTESGTLAARNAAQTDPDLALIVEHWHDLPDDAKRNIQHVVKSYAKTPDPTARREGVRAALEQAHATDQSQDRTYEGERP